MNECKQTKIESHEESRLGIGILSMWINVYKSWFWYSGNLIPLLMRICFILWLLFSQ